MPLVLQHLSSLTKSILIDGSARYPFNKWSLDIYTMVTLPFIRFCYKNYESRRAIIAYYVDVLYGYSAGGLELNCRLTFVHLSTKR